MKNKKALVIVLIVLVVIAAVLFAVLGGKAGKNDEDVANADHAVSERLSEGDIETDASVSGISVVSVDTIFGMYVEDGSDEVMDDILTVTFRNEAEVALQYAKLILSIGDEDYTFEISTVPAGESVRAMEMNRKLLVSGKGDISLNQENIAWFNEELSLHDDIISITQKDSALILENISSEIISAPIYVMYKTDVDDVYIGGITYRTGTQENLEPGQSVALSAAHFDPETSKILLVTYGQ